MSNDRHNDSEPKFTRKELHLAYWHGVRLYDNSLEESPAKAAEAAERVDEIQETLVRAFDDLESKFLKGDYSTDPKAMNYCGAQEMSL
jgi:hypothetical protein